MENNIFLEQLPFGAESFADNAEPRCPCVLVLDTSSSMTGKPINELNEGLSLFKNEICADTLASKRVEVSIITFGPVKVENYFQTIDQFSPPKLIANGDTPIGSAVKRAIELVRKRKEELRINGIQLYRPWIFLITDGGPTDEWYSASTLIQEGEKSNSFAFFAVGVEAANMSILEQLSVRSPLHLKGLQFRELFIWLSNSMKSVSSSIPGTSVPLSTPKGWAEI